MKKLFSIITAGFLIATYGTPLSAIATANNSSGSINYCHLPSRDDNKAQKHMDEPINSWNGHKGHEGDFIIYNAEDETLCDAIVAGTACADQVDNDSDGLIDSNDPGCWTNPDDPDTYNPLDDDETDIVPVNNPPILDPIGSHSGDELTSIQFDANATDADGDTLTFSTVGAPSGASIDPTSGVFSWVPTEAQGFGVYTFDVCVSDGEASDCESVTITVNEANIAPVALDIFVSTHENTPKVVVVSATDSDLPLNFLSFFVVTAPTNGYLDAMFSGNEIAYTPNTGYLGSDSFTYKVNDGLIDGNTATVYVTVDNNAPTMFQIPDQTVDELVPLNLTATANDPDQDTLTFSLGGTPPAGASINPSTGEFSWTPTEEQGPSIYPITVIVSDNSLSDSTVFVVTVNEVNQAPVASDGTLNTSENVSVTATMNSTDPDLPAQTLTYSVVDAPISGTLGTVLGNQVVYTPNNGFVGTDTFTFKANDSELENNESNVATITINVSDTAQCADGADNDGDGKTDSIDPGCSSSEDNDESDDPIICDEGFHLEDSECVPNGEESEDVCANIDGVQANVPQGYRQEGNNCVPVDINPPSGSSSSGGGGGGSSFSGGRQRDISGLLASAGEVLGAATEESLACEPYLKSYIKLGANNDPEEVKKLQVFLNQFFEVDNPVTGVYGPITYEMVKKFQLHEESAVLTPWAIAGYPTNGPTGYVYKTTKRWINILKCPDMISTTPIPPLP
jgi:hypothetical protein